MVDEVATQGATVVDMVLQEEEEEEEDIEEDFVDEAQEALLLIRNTDKLSAGLRSE